MQQLLELDRTRHLRRRDRIPGKDLAGKTGICTRMRQAAYQAARVSLVGLADRSGFYPENRDGDRKPRAA